jgi:hypothetical protein
MIIYYVLNHSGGHSVDICGVFWFIHGTVHMTFRG